MTVLRVGALPTVSDREMMGQKRTIFLDGGVIFWDSPDAAALAKLLARAHRYHAGSDY